jgi:hypothetical protein
MWNHLNALSLIGALALMFAIGAFREAEWLLSIWLLSLGSGLVYMGYVRRYPIQRRSQIDQMLPLWLVVTLALTVLAIIRIVRVS